jgi:hypothetical protein
VPESIIPSADAFGPKPFGVSFQMLSKSRGSVCLRVSGAVAPSAPASKPISPDVTVSKQIRGKHDAAKAVNAAAASINEL